MYTFMYRIRELEVFPCLQLWTLYLLNSEQSGGQQMTRELLFSERVNITRINMFRFSTLGNTLRLNRRNFQNTNSHRVLSEPVSAPRNGIISLRPWWFSGLWSFQLVDALREGTAATLSSRSINISPTLANKNSSHNTGGGFWLYLSAFVCALWTSL